MSRHASTMAARPALTLTRRASVSWILQARAVKTIHSRLT